MVEYDLKIGYAGMSHLGVNSSVAAAEKVSKVVAYDRDKIIIDQLKLGETKIDEPNLKEKINKLKEKILYTSNIKDLIECDIVYISKDVPTDNNGKSNFQEIIPRVRPHLPYPLLTHNAFVRRNAFKHLFQAFYLLY